MLAIACCLVVGFELWLGLQLGLGFIDLVSGGLQVRTSIGNFIIRKDLFIIWGGGLLVLPCIASN